MPTQLLSLAPTNATDADYRAWGKGISDAFTAFGIPKTSDTGQADWANAIKPAVSTYPQSEIRKFNDALAAIYPVFFKIDFGSQSNAYPAVRLTIGTGSDGAGNITTPVSNAAIANVVTNITATSTTSNSCALSGSSGRFAIAMFFSLNAGFYFSLERTKDDNGQDTGEGILFSVSSTSGLANHYWNFGNPPVAEASGLFMPTVASGGNLSGADGTTINIYPNFFFRGGSPVVGLNTIGVFNGDIQGTNPTTFTVLNGSHAYYFIGGSGTTNNLNKVARGATVGTGIGMRWE